MLLIDVNVLVYAHRQDSARHVEYLEWMENVVNGAEPFGIPDIVFSGFLRVVTHPKVFNPPSDMKAALAFANQIRTRPNCVVVTPGANHWRTFTRLCEGAGIKRNLVADAYLAAMAIELDCDWITTDGDYARFTGLKWRHPLRAR
jgi:toxin-antitoxin system PIN domain toxin